ncbi:hypothetical protein [Paenibacillus yanchengensis]|uniref:Uncharacterized protein n=1 Tax=Paenibacillus yanchengensis TaxID=2035833 RepID=A0ABW4YLE7_9BACL
MQMIVSYLALVFALISSSLTFSSYFMSRKKYEEVLSIYCDSIKQHQTETNKLKNEIDELYIRLNAMRLYLSEDELEAFCEKFSLQKPE